MSSAPPIEPSILRPDLAGRLATLPPYVFTTLNKIKAEVKASGVDLVDLGMGNPDRPTPQPIIERLMEAVQNPENHGYPDFRGKVEFREATANWMQRRYNVTINPNTQFQPLIGSKEGLAHLIQAYAEHGSMILVPSVAYPTYWRITELSGAERYELPATAENNYLPDLDAIPDEVWAKARLLLLNYPNNPTAAIAPRSYYERAVALCRQHDVKLVNDMAYGELLYDGTRSESILSIPGAEDCAIEFHSFSKTFNMAGWRLGFAVGAEPIIKMLYSMKTNLDYGVCNAVQDGAVHALNHAEAFIPDIVSEYQARRDLLVDGFRSLGWQVDVPKGTFYLWLPIPPAARKAGMNSFAWCEHVMRQAGVVFTPGAAFGQDGDSHFRVSFVSPQDQLTQALERLSDKQLTF